MDTTPAKHPIVRVANHFRGELVENRMKALEATGLLNR